jgi:hypothetical protein
MKPWQVAALTLTGLAAGFLAGRASGRPEVSELEATLQRERDTLKSRAEKAETELATLRETKRRPRESVQGPPGAIPADTRTPFDEPKPPAPAKGALTAEARKNRVNEIRGALAGYVENHEGDKVLAALKELASLAPEGRDDAMKLALDINRDINGSGELQIPQQSFYGGLGEPAIRDLMTWSLENPASSPAEFRQLTGWSLPYVLAPDDVISRYDAALGHESDVSVQTVLVQNLGMMNTAKAESVLTRLLGESARDVSVRAAAAMGLSVSKDPAAQRALDATAAAYPDPRIQTAQKISAVFRDPPASGCLVLGTTSDGSAALAGMKAGDLIVSYNGRAVPSDADLRREQQAAAGSDTVPIVVLRDGHETTLQSKPGRLGIDMKAVTRK